MFRKITVGLVTIFAALFLINSSYAAIDSFYTTDSNGGTAPKSIFDWDETPWLYIKLSDNVKHITSTWWNDPNGNSYDVIIGGSQANTHWLSLPDWDTVKTTGKWNIEGDIFYTNGTCSHASTGFTVTPEPISASLFLLGGGALALRQYRKRKK